MHIKYAEISAITLQFHKNLRMDLYHSTNNKYPKEEVFSGNHLTAEPRAEKPGSC